MYHLQERALLLDQLKAMFLYPRRKILKLVLMFIRKLKVEIILGKDNNACLHYSR